MKLKNTRFNNLRKQCLVGFSHTEQSTGTRYCYWILVHLLIILVFPERRRSVAVSALHDGVILTEKYAVMTFTRYDCTPGQACYLKRHNINAVVRRIQC